MSDTTHNRFEIDLDEIERQLRRSAEGGASGSSAETASDPLAELARIVGQNDPFSSIFADRDRDAKRPPPDAAEEPSPAPAAPVQLAPDVVLTAEDRGILGAEPLDADPQEVAVASRYDPVSQAYGSPEKAVEAEDFTPLPPRRSRRRLAAVVGVLALSMAAAGAAFTWRKHGGNFASSGPPPLIKADNAPLKVAPQNPGGMDIPNQNRQIYERGTEVGRARVLDRQEQPIDVREAARSMPAQDAPAPIPSGTSAPSDPAASATRSLAPASSPATATGPAVVASEPTTVTSPRVPEPSAAVQPPVTPRFEPSQPNAVVSALGEPRRVRTVAVRPDGSAIGPEGGAVTLDPSRLIPSTSLPRPVSVPTVSIPANPAAAPAPAAPAASNGVPTGPMIAVLPPQRPGRPGTPNASSEDAPAGAAGLRTDAPPAAETEAAAPSQAGAIPVLPPARPSRAGARAPTPTQVASIAETPETETPAPASGRSYSVQLAVSPSEQAARAAYEQLSTKYPVDLGGKPATVTRAEVSGKSVYRVRVAPLSREDANTLCTRLKSSGGQCFVVAN